MERTQTAGAGRDDSTHRRADPGRECRGRARRKGLRRRRRRLRVLSHRPSRPPCRDSCADRRRRNRSRFFDRTAGIVGHHNRRHSPLTRSPLMAENAAIARIFSEIADLLEIKSGNPFKIRAYRNAADTIVHTTDRLSACSDDQLKAIPGIGKDLAAKIREICDTGGSEYHRELLEEFPPTILDLLHLPGVGPKTVAQLYRELNIRTL